MKVLVVDDVDVMVRSLQHMLQRHGYSVVTAASGEEALECLARDMAIDVVISGLSNQPMDGVELYRRALGIERFNDSGVMPPPAFVLLTSCENMNHRETRQSELEFARREFAAIISKPVSAAKLLPVLEKIDVAKTEDSHHGSVIAKLLNETSGRLRRARDKSAVDTIVRELLMQIERLHGSGEPVPV